MPIEFTKETLLKVSIGGIIAATHAIVSATYVISKKLNQLDLLVENVSSLQSHTNSLSEENLRLKGEIDVLNCRELEARRNFDQNLAIIQSLTTAIDLRLGGDPASGAGREHISSRMEPLLQKADDWNNNTNCD
jgi:hypothetical protein